MLATEDQRTQAHQQQPYESGHEESDESRPTHRLRLSTPRLTWLLLVCLHAMNVGRRVDPVEHCMCRMEGVKSK